MYRRLASIVRTSHTTRRTTRPTTTTTARHNMTTTTTTSTSRPTMRHLSTTNSNSDDNANTNVNVIVNTNTKPSPFKKWPMRMIESQGDYQQDAEILEPIIGGPLYSSQPNLPRLPIPNLIDTIQTFLPTALPLMESEQEARALVEKCKAFPKQAEVLHQKLLERMDKGSGSGSGKGSDTSWLQLWWNQDGYLKIRDPITVNVSYFFHFTDDPSITVNNGDSMESNLQIKRGAAMLHATAEFRKQICSGTWPHQAIGRKDPKTPLCSAAFKYMFHSCRIPKRYMDTYKMYDPSLGEHRHCVVARKGRFYKFDFVKKDGDPIGVDLLEWHLRKCVQMADDAYVTANADANVNSHSHSHLHTEMELGWLTSSDRDSWADAREEILRVGGMEMQQALEWLESGALLLCLDDDDVEPFSKKQCADVFWTGDLASGGNRWFDKSIQLFCTKNGKAGLQGEHSMMDGMPMITFADYITEQSYASAQKKSNSNEHVSQSGSAHNNDEGGVQDIFAKCYPLLNSGDSKVQSMIQKAKSDFHTLVTEQEQAVQSFQGYGSNFIKKAGYSPDAYAQMAIQLAVYRLHGKQVGTYEATQMRPFLHGRTETTRTVSKESSQFVKRMGKIANFNDDTAAIDEKKALLQYAVNSHAKYIGNAGKGKGVDRHFFGMAMLADEKDKMPDLYSDPLFIRSKTWRVSTSHLTHKNIENWGFGEVVPDGLGIAYAVKSDCCIFNIAARKEHGWTEKFSHLLEEALLEMKVLHDASSPTSKL